MRDHGLVPVQEKAKKTGLTRPDMAAGPIPDLVSRDFTAGAPGEKLVGDITEIATGEGPLYLATAIDCYSKAVAGYAMDERYPAALVSAALDAAAQQIAIPEGAIFHSDRGSQYTSAEFGRTIEKHRMRRSVGRTGICFDNSMAESFFGKIKTEYIDHIKFDTRAEARRAVIWYINVFYNRQRLHSGLGYRPPFEILQEWLDDQTAA
ncbi:MAG: IS3 family transposase, partial [Gammaproteobacteria bacterium]